MKISPEKKMIFLVFLLKTYIVDTRQNRLSESVLTSTHNVCFGSKIRKINLVKPHGHVFLMQ